MSKDSSAKYYEKQTKKALKKTRERCQDLPEKGKSERYKNLPEDEKRRLAEYRKTDYKSYFRKFLYCIFRYFCFGRK